ncbi:MAG TPA: hypothetical protein PKA00_20295 [Saprospiraceae bacterium]|nr:hypothetical protein [Saprospiraceae bacterium]HMQ85262.1 hypothetical protein [Saprospiraceae bacterium]
MRVKKNKFLLWSIALLFLFTLSTLSFAIALYANRHADMAGKSSLQLSRIDFKETIDPVLAQSVKNSIAKTEGVNHVYFNESDGILVFSHDNRIQSADQIFENIQSNYDLNMERFVVSDEMAQGSCPVTGQHSILLKVGGFFYGLLVL